MAIVMGFIPTPEGRAALSYAAREANLRKVPLVVVDSHHGGSSYDVSEAERFDEELTRVKEGLLAEDVDFRIRTFVRGNDPSEDLVTAAEEVGAELIVIGLRRRSPVGKLILGSNAQQILLHAECPVLAVKAGWEPQDAS